MIWLIALNIVAQLLDVHSTSRVLSRGGVELNPVARWLLNRVGMWPVAMAKLGLAVALVWATYPLLWPGLIMAGIFMAVALNNYRSAR